MSELAEREGEALAATEEGQLLLDLLTGKVEPPALDADALNARITAQMLAAETPEQALAAGATASFEDGLLGVPVEVQDLYFRKSSLQGGAPVFALVAGVNTQTGEEVTITCGAAQVMRTLGVWKVRGWLPQVFVVDKSPTPTGDGFTPYTIRTA